jgi:alpha-galactosidase
MRVSHDDEAQVWSIDAGLNTLILRMERGQLHCEHFGAPELANRSFAGPPPSWPDHGQQLFRGRRDVAVVLRGQVSPLALRVDKWSHTATDFNMELVGLDAPLRVVIHCAFSQGGACLDRCTTLHHTGDVNSAPLDIASASSFSCAVSEATSLMTTSGWWVSETQLSRADPRTPILLESRSGKTGFEHAPYLAIEGRGRTTVIELGWSGNWMMHAAPLWDARVHVSGGLNSFGLRHSLMPGQSLVLPSALMVSVPGDLNAATQHIHRARRSRRIAPRRPIPVHYNTWYPHPGEASVDQLLELIPNAVRLGCESFVLDAGWYTTASAPQGDHWLKWAGDWTTNRALYPNGLSQLSGAVQHAGMGFGLWFEPEAAGPESDLVKQHPDWIHDVPAFAWGPDDLRVVNFGVADARAHILAAVVAQLTDTGATWMKWDFNANIWEGGWDARLGTRTDDPLVAHYRGVYDFQQQLLDSVPGLVLEMCSSGGGRFDSEIMRRAHTGWASDQWLALQNLSIHHGSHYLHPPEEITDWLIEWPPRLPGDGNPYGPDDDFNAQTDLRFRTHVAMLGSFGISAPLQRWADDDIALVRREVDRYRSFVRDLLPVSDQYILTEQPPLVGGGDWSAMWFAAHDGSGGSLSAFRSEGDATCEFSLVGLDPDALFDISTSDGAVDTMRGSQLEAGFGVTLDERYRSQMFQVQRAANGSS